MCLVGVMTVLFRHRVPVPGMETHIPVLFLDLSGTFVSPSATVILREPAHSLSVFPLADDFQSSLSAPLAGGQDASLSEEEVDDFFDLHIVKHYDPEVGGFSTPISSYILCAGTSHSFLCLVLWSR